MHMIGKKRKIKSDEIVVRLCYAILAPIQMKYWAGLKAQWANIMMGSNNC